MSYFIEYDKKVIKTTRGYIFMCLGGDNNVSEPKWINGKWREVRARSWFHYNHHILEAPEEAIMAFCMDAYSGDPDYEVHKKGGKWVYRKDMPNYFRDGMRRAQSLEQLIRANRGQTLDGCVAYYETRDSISYKTEMNKCLRTTEELEKWLDQARPLREKYLAEGKECYIRLSFCGNEPLRYGTPENAGKVVIKSTSRKHSSYVCSYIPSKQICFEPDLEKAVVFESEEAARAAVGPCWENIKFVSLESQQKAAKAAQKPKPFLIQFGAGKLSGNFLARTTKNTVYGSRDADRAKKFATEKEATSFAQSLRDRGCDEARYGKFALVNTITGARTVLPNPVSKN